MTQAVVLAGGLATRMHPVTERLPKVLLPVAGRPFILHLLERLRDGGYESVVLCLGHLGAMVQELLAAQPRNGPTIAYAFDGDRLLGTAGALRAAIGLLEDVFLVTYGDSYLPFDYKAPLETLMAHPEASGCLAVYENRDRIEPSNCAIEAGLVVRYDKARTPGPPLLDHIDYGAIALRREVVAGIAADAVLGLEVVQADLASRRRLLAHVARDRFYEIGSAAGLSALEAHLEGRT